MKQVVSNRKALSYGGLKLDLGRGMLRLAGQKIPLAPSHASLMGFLMRKAGSPYSQAQVAEMLDANAATLKVHIKNMREKLGNIPLRDGATMASLVLTNSFMAAGRRGKLPGEFYLNTHLIHALDSGLSFDGVRLEPHLTLRHDFEQKDNYALSRGMFSGTYTHAGLKIDTETGALSFKDKTIMLDGHCAAVMSCLIQNPSKIFFCNDIQMSRQAISSETFDALEAALKEVEIAKGITGDALVLRDVLRSPRRGPNPVQVYLNTTLLNVLNTDGAANMRVASIRTDHWGEEVLGDNGEYEHDVARRVASLHL